jgi:hypothetical protein
VKLEPTGWCRGVDPFTERDEGDPDGLEIIEERDEVLQVAPEPIQPPADEHIEPSALGILQERIQGRPTILRP